MVAMEEILVLELLYGVEDGFFLVCDKGLRLFAHNRDEFLEEILVHFHCLTVGDH